MKNLENLNEWIIRYNEGTLAGKDLKSFQRLLKEDPDVKKETELDKEITDFLSDKDLLEFYKLLDDISGKRTSKPGLNYLLLAAVVLLLIAFGGGWLFHHTLKRIHVLPEVNSLFGSG